MWPWWPVSWHRLGCPKLPKISKDGLDLVGGLGHFFLVGPDIGNFIITGELIYFRGVEIPPAEDGSGKPFWCSQTANFLGDATIDGYIELYIEKQKTKGNPGLKMLGSHMHASYMHTCIHMYAHTKKHTNIHTNIHYPTRSCTGLYIVFLSNYQNWQLWLSIELIPCQKGNLYQYHCNHHANLSRWPSKISEYKQGFWAFLYFSSATPFWFCMSFCAISTPYCMYVYIYI